MCLDPFPLRQAHSSGRLTVFHPLRWVQHHSPTRQHSDHSSRRKLYLICRATTTKKTSSTDSIERQTTHRNDDDHHGFRRCLTRQQFGLSFWPFPICGECQQSLSFALSPRTKHFLHRSDDIQYNTGSLVPRRRSECQEKRM